MSAMDYYTLYGTFDVEVSGYPGFVEVTVEAPDKKTAEAEAHRLLREAVNDGKFIYRTVKKRKEPNA